MQPACLLAMETSITATGLPAVGLLALAPGVWLDDAETHAAHMLRCAQGMAYLNPAALAILALCDGSRDRDALIAAAVRGSDGCLSASDAVAFLDAARARGWVIER